MSLLGRLPAVRGPALAAARSAPKGFAFEPAALVFVAVGFALAFSSLPLGSPTSRFGGVRPHQPFAVERAQGVAAVAPAAVPANSASCNLRGILPVSWPGLAFVFGGAEPEVSYEVKSAERTRCRVLLVCCRLSARELGISPQRCTCTSKEAAEITSL